MDKKEKEVADEIKILCSKFNEGMKRLTKNVMVRLYHLNLSFFPNYVSKMIYLDITHEKLATHTDFRKKVYKKIRTLVDRYVDELGTISLNPGNIINGSSK